MLWTSDATTISHNLTFTELTEELAFSELFLNVKADQKPPKNAIPFQYQT